MDELREERMACPCCGEPITLTIDTSLDEQSYVEDCPICCRPLLVHVIVADEHVQIAAHPENE